MISCVILSFTADDYYRDITQQALDSLRSSDFIDYSIVLVETNSSKDIHYDGVKLIQPECSFNYNKFVNIGLSECVKSDYYIISNNDVIFHNNWFVNIRYAMERFNLDSASPFEPNWPHHITMPDQYIHYGYRSEHELTGWCIVAKSHTLEKIGPFDPQFEWWFQDNDYAMNLQKHDLSHGLVSTSKVTHLSHKSNNLLDNPDHMTEGMRLRFNKKWSL